MAKGEIVAEGRRLWYNRVMRDGEYILNLLRGGTELYIYGPPGRGKTYLLEQVMLEQEFEDAILNCFEFSAVRQYHQERECSTSEHILSLR